MPPKSRQVRQIIRGIQKDPELLQDLLKANDDDARKSILVGRGLVASGEHGPTRAEAQKEIAKLVRAPVAEAGEEERPVEWVAAIGTAAAGAGAAFCAAE